MAVKKGAVILPRMTRAMCKSPNEELPGSLTGGARASVLVHRCRHSLERPPWSPGEA